MLFFLFHYNFDFNQYGLENNNTSNCNNNNSNNNNNNQYPNLLAIAPRKLLKSLQKTCYLCEMQFLR